MPPGFTITTQAWAHYNRAGRQWPEGLWEQILENLARLEQDARARARRRATAAAGLGALGRARVDARHDGDRPQPGPQRRDGRWAGAWTRNERFAWDCYRRFITMFGDVVLGIDRDAFDALLDA